MREWIGRKGVLAGGRRLELSKPPLSLSVGRTYRSESKTLTGKVTGCRTNSAYDEGEEERKIPWSKVA